MIDRLDLRFDALLRDTGVIAILRGLPTADAVDVVDALIAAGIRIVEVPLNSPTPFASIRLLREHFGDKILVGAGTVLTIGQVDELAASGGQICVSPNSDPLVIAAAIRRNMIPIPGFGSATEAFAAIAAGARYLKVFPAGSSIGLIEALKAVLPAETVLIAVGGVGPNAMGPLARVGCNAFGLGSDLYAPGRDLNDIHDRAIRALDAARSAASIGVRLLCNPVAAIGESPIWLADRNAIAWLDPVGRRLFRYDPATAAVGEVSLSRSLWGMASGPDGSVFATTDTGVCRLDPDNGQTSNDIAMPLAPGCRPNDLAVDKGGGLWLGTMHRAGLSCKGSVVYCSDSGQPKVAATGLGVPNGLVVSDDQKTLYIVDTLNRTLLRYPLDATVGMLGEPMIVTDFMGIAGKPDGMTASSDGSLIVAMWGGGCVVTIGTDGTVLDQVEIPAPNVSSVLNVDGQLFATTSAMRLSPADMRRYPASGGLFQRLSLCGTSRR